ncbi:hypothetical protein AcW1_008730 [Taiwanofungus camphoratus]|nr:hypothetical protein AcW1_008730 [Antrodia cinnamomea]
MASLFSLPVALRVWGGGIYQPLDTLTGVYDELGILAWSEIIFSDATYPLNSFLLEPIDPGVRQNERRNNKQRAVGGRERDREHCYWDQRYGPKQHALSRRGGS